MFSPPQRIVIASRRSALAQWQAQYVANKLRALYPECQIDITGITTRGDQILDRSLAKIGGKGLFIKELEEAMLAGQADIAVHSLKDMPVNLSEEFCLGAITEREDPHDAFVSNQYESLAQLPKGSIVGTSSLRRESQLRARFPHLQIHTLRGNVETRLKRLDQGEYAAIILAAAGLIRLGLAQRIKNTLPMEDSLPAVGQGALAIEYLQGRADVATWLRPLSHVPTQQCVIAERACSRELGGSCELPLGAYAEIVNQKIRLRCFVGTPDGKRVFFGELYDYPEYPEQLGQKLARQLKAQGAGEILNELVNSN